MEKDEMVLIIEFVSLAKKFLSDSSYVKIKSILYDEVGFISDEGIGENSGPIGHVGSCVSTSNSLITLSIEDENSDGQ